MAGLIALALVTSLVLLDEDIGRAKTKPSARSILAKSAAVNQLSAARFFLFGSRDIWFVVALPIFLDEELGWSFSGIGAFMAAWVIGYGMVQSLAPRAVGDNENTWTRTATQWALALAALTVAMAILVAADTATTIVVICGLLLFGAVFALTSSLHSFLILAYSESEDDVAMDVGFYYSANAAGRLAGTLLSGLLYLAGGLTAALFGSAACLAATWLLSLRLPPVGASRQPLAQPTTP